MIREAKLSDAARIAEIEVMSCRYAYKDNAFELHFIYVDPDYMRSGAGTEMLDLFELKGREKGCTEFVIWVLEDNGIGKNFYSKHGYSSDGKEKIFRRWNKREIRYVKKAI